jgi:hypothetical protein
VSLLPSHGIVEKWVTTLFVFYELLHFLLGTDGREATRDLHGTRRPWGPKPGTACCGSTVAWEIGASYIRASLHFFSLLGQT